MEPVGRRAEIEAGASLLAAAQAGGAGLVSLCGGEGWCHGCVVHVVAGEVSPPTTAERQALTETQLSEGCRLACQAIPLGDVRLDIPPDSLTAPQRLQVEGRATEVAADPLVTGVDLRLAPPTLRDLRSDAARLEAALAEQGQPSVRISYPVLAALPERLREQEWTCRAVLRQGEVVAVLPLASRLVGLAVDIGTTKLAGYLVDLASGQTLAQMGAMNPQIAYGEDVISRIAHAEQHAQGRQQLQERVVAAVSEMADGLCAEARVSPDQIVETVVVGNTAMHHLFAGLPVRHLALAPYVPVASQALSLPVRDLGLRVAPGGYVELLPNIAGYVGADHVAVILATDLWRTSRTTLVVDIGTNTEITLAAGGRLLSCSCASGPAFEGAHIRDGMRAAPGAIERVCIVQGKVHIYTVGGQAPVGLCGSGILDAVAEMRAAGVLDASGAMQMGAEGVRSTEQGPEYVLVAATQSGHGRDIVVTGRDVREIQLAKGAIRAGLDILLAEAGIDAGDVEQFLIAGAFGTYLDLSRAVRLGMFPEVPLERFRQVGNAAGMGAKQVLINAGRLRIASEVSRQVSYLELTTYPSFQERFLGALSM
jgi:uncharacterized 2Fe-2S/4Fe-4S cluster protein (DUF4445 family)